MRHIAPILALALMSVPVPSRIAAQGAADAARTRVGSVTTVSRNQASISGTVVTQAGRPLPNTTVQARNLLTGRIGGSAVTTPNGQFSIAGLDPGNYVLEVVDAAGQIIGTSAFISAPAGTTAATTVTVTTGSGVTAPLTSTAAKSVIYAAAAAGVAAVVVAANVETASPSR